MHENALRFTRRALVFLPDGGARTLEGRFHWKECWWRIVGRSSDALHCGRPLYLDDDLDAHNREPWFIPRRSGLAIRTSGPVPPGVDEVAVALEPV